MNVDTAGLVGLHTSLKLDPNGRLHVSYQKFGDFDLKYATCADDCTVAGNWQSATVDSVGGAGDYGSLTLDRTGGSM